MREKSRLFIFVFGFLLMGILIFANNQLSIFDLSDGLPIEQNDISVNQPSMIERQIIEEASNLFKNTKFFLIAESNEQLELPLVKNNKGKNTLIYDSNKSIMPVKIYGSEEFLVPYNGTIYVTNIKKEH